MNKLLISIFCLAVLLAAGCDKNAANPGEVALVNGKAITIKQLQAAHDSQVLTGDGPNRDPEELRKEYSSVLSELITQELVAQELEKKKIPVSEEELALAEQELRRDFPPGGFETMLLEESVDVDMWRDALRKRLGVQKFYANILRPQVTISTEEVEAYYLAHEADFKIPERVNFIQFSSLIKDQVTAACEQFRKDGDVASIQERFANMTIRVVVMREDRLAPEMVKALGKLNPLDASPALEMNGEYLAMVLLKKEPAYLLPREEIYSRIETILLEDKIQTAFQKWLATAIGKADIKISVHLLPGRETPQK